MVLENLNNILPFNIPPISFRNLICDLEKISSQLYIHAFQNKTNADIPILEPSTKQPLKIYS
jgi:hypothetical protein